MKLALALLLATPVMSVPLASCTHIPAADLIAKLDRIESAINVATRIAEAAASSGILSAAGLEKFRNAANTARDAVRLARAAVMAGDTARAEHWKNEAERWLNDAASGVPEAPEAVAAEMARGQ